MSAPPPARVQGTLDAAAGATRERLGRLPAAERARGTAFHLLVFLAAMIAIAGLVALIVQAAVEGRPRLDSALVTEQPSSVAEEGGFQSAIYGTLLIMAGVIVTVVPLGIGAAIYLEEFADQTRWYNRLIEVNIQNLAAVPSIVFGILGLGLIVRGPLDLGFVAYAGSLTLSLLVLPTVILACREALRAVPSSIREGALALGATRWQSVRHQVLPAAVPGIVTGVILALSRAIGETAPLLLVGATVFVTFNPEGPFEGAYTALPVAIFNYVARPQEEFRVLAAAGILVLLVVLLLMNSFAIWLRNRYSQRW
ncbi:MAG TPA: phosphate ABC transporter permease PstA [Solirubrobacteraceae bacterium]|nr:phosphate ABC transporter permease PstA [Solirubrobacteraceae bacterium]